MRPRGTTRVMAQDEPSPNWLIPVAPVSYAYTPAFLARMGFDRTREFDPYVTVESTRFSPYDQQASDCQIFRKGSGASQPLFKIGRSDADGSTLLSPARVAWLLAGRSLRDGEKIKTICRKRQPGSGVCVAPHHLRAAGVPLSDEDAWILLLYGAADFVHPRGAEGLPSNHPRRRWWDGLGTRQPDQLAHITFDPLVQSQRIRDLAAVERLFWGQTDRHLRTDPLPDPAEIAAQMERLLPKYEEQQKYERLESDPAVLAREEALYGWYAVHPKPCWRALGTLTNGYPVIHLSVSLRPYARQLAWALACRAEIGSPLPIGRVPVDGLQSYQIARIVTTCGNERCVRNDGPNSHLRVESIPSNVYELIEATVRDFDASTAGEIAERLWLRPEPVHDYFRAKREELKLEKMKELQRRYRGN